MRNAYLTLFVINTRSGLAVNYSINTAVDQKEARADALRLIDEKYRGQNIQVLETSIIPNEVIDQVYESRH